MKNARFVIDWDGTLVEDAWPEQGPWLPGAVDALHELSRHGDIVIFSCRVSDFAFPSRRHASDDIARDPDIVAHEIHRMEDMLEEAGVTAEVWTRPYKPAATVYIDNRGISFRGDWHETLNEVYSFMNPKTPMRFRDPGRTVADDIRLAAMGMGVFANVAETEGTVTGTLEKAKKAYVLGLTDEKPWYVEGDPGLDRLGEEVTSPELELVTPRSCEGCQCDGSCGLTPKPIRHPNSQAFHDRLKAWGDLHDRKQADYGTLVDPFANIRQGAAEIGLPGWIGCAIRMRDKMQRILTAAKQYIETGEVSMANEALVDSFDDLGVYAGIGAVLLEEES